MAVGQIQQFKLQPIAGVKLGTVSAGIKTPGRQDLVLIELCLEASVAGVFTQNQFCAAPVKICQKNLSETEPAYLVINTGNANAGTGAEGYADALRVCQKVADLTSVKLNQVLPFSTGVIGEKLPIDKINSALPQAQSILTEDAWEAAAEGILTTDTRIKTASVQFDCGGTTLSITGIAKGSGMIKPNMATMLSYVATDAKIDQPLLQQLLTTATNQSFNRITVDSDTSTNDSGILIASAKSGQEISHQQPELLEIFQLQLNKLMLDLAQAIVRDGEGATKFVTVRISQAATQDEALNLAYDIAHSPLVKTALFASDPNWGRILAVVGRSGIKDLNIDSLKIFLDDLCIVSAGGRDIDYVEADGQKVMDQEEIEIHVQLARGDIEECIWTTDLSHDYISINADYRS